MNPEIKEMARQSGHIARTTANETKNSKLRELAVAVFGLAMAIERISECLPENPQKKTAAAIPKANPGKRVKA